MERAEGVEDSQGGKALEIHRPQVHKANVQKMLPERKVSKALGFVSDLKSTSHRSVARALLKVRLTLWVRLTVYIEIYDI